MKVRVDSTRCTGHGRCYSLAPEVFQDDEYAYSVVVKPEIDGASPLAEDARYAASSCPEVAIEIGE